MKHLGSIFALAVLGFWLLMNTLLVLNERESARLDVYRAGVTRFIGSELYRERTYAIYKKRKIIGYSSQTMEKVFAEGGIEIHQSLETSVQMEPLGLVSASGNLVLDENLRPSSLAINLQVSGLLATISGERKGRNFRVTIRSGVMDLPALELPLEELVLGDVLMAPPPVAGFQRGDTFRVACFDPTTFRRELLQVTVTDHKARDHDGVLVDAFLLESEVHGQKSKAWVTQSGELLEQEFGPPLEDYSLRATKRESVHLPGKK